MEGDRSKAGVISATYSAALRQSNVNPQRFWKNAVNGPNARMLAAKREKILSAVRDAMKEKGGAAAEMADAFYKRHWDVLAELSVVSHLTCKTTKLTEEEHVELSHACGVFGDACGDAWRTAF